MKNILLIPGFLCDTFSSIEKISIHLTKAVEDKFNILWLVPTIDNKYNKFKNNNKIKLTCPLYVEELKKRNINYIVGDISKYNILKNLFLFWQIFRKYHIDAVLTQFGFERFYGAFFGKIFGKTTIWYEHWFSLGTKGIFLKKHFYRFFVDYFIAVSDYIGSTLPSGKIIYVIHHGIEIKPVISSTTSRLELKDQLGLAKFDYIVLMIAAYSPEKRYDIAIEIAEKVVNRNKNVGFLFLGDGPLRKKYMEVIKAKKLIDFIIMPGHKLNVEDYLLISDLLILTSISDSFGYCLLEAMMYKLPVVAFNLGGPKEIIKNGSTGYLLSYNNINGFVNAILEIIKDKEKRFKMGEAGFEKLKQEFDIEIWKKRILDVFEKIFNCPIA